MNTDGIGSKQLSFNFANNSKLNATRGAADVKQKEVKEKTSGPNLDSKVDIQQPAVTEPQFSSGIKEKQLPDGSYSAETQSGVDIKYTDEGDFTLKMPNGYTLTSDSEQNLKLTPPDGVKADDLAKPVLTDDDVSFHDHKGSKFTVDLENLAFTAEDRTKSVKQLIYPDGNQEMLVTARYDRPGEKKVEQHYGAIFTDQARQADEGLKIGNGEVSFPTPNGGPETSRTIPYPLPELKTATEPPPLPQNQDVRVESQPTVDQQPAVTNNPTTLEPVMDNTAAVQPEVTHTKSGVIRQKLGPDIQLTVLPNGAHVIEKPDGAVAYTAKGEQVKVETKNIENANGDPDVQFTFQDGPVHFSVFKNSFDVVGEDRGGKRAQIAHPDGRIFSTVRDLGGVHTTTIHPDGKVTSSGGASINPDDPSVMVVKHDDRDLKFKMPFDNWAAEKGDAPDNLVTSGYVPGMFPTAAEVQDKQSAQSAEQPPPLPSYENEPGKPQAGHKPSRWQIFKSLFTGEDPWANTRGQANPGRGNPNQSYHGPGQTQFGPPPGQFYTPGHQVPPEMGGWPSNHHDPMGGYMEMMRQQERMNNMMMMMTMGGSLISSMMFPMMFFGCPFF